MGRIRVAIPGGNILTDLTKNLAFDSDRACLTIVNERIDSFAEVNWDGGHTTSIAHGLDYRPTIKCLEEESSGVWSKSLGIKNVWADTTNINYAIYDGYGSAITHRIKTTILANSQNGIVAGTLSNANGRVQVARVGYDLDSITDLRQVAFSSKKGVILVNEKKTITVSHDGTPDSLATASYAHGLGYIPDFEAVETTYGSIIPYDIYGGGGVNLFLRATTDVTNITCSVYDAGGFLGGPVDFYFRVHILCSRVE